MFTWFNLQPVGQWLGSVYDLTIANPTLWATVCSAVIIALGVAGTIFPVLPGTILILCGFIVYGLIAGFAGMGLYFFIGQAMLIGLSYLIDFIATAMGVKVYGGSSAAIWGAMIGVLAIFVIGPIGILVGPLVGAIMGELIMGKELKASMKAGFGSFVGFLLGSLAKLVIATIMIIWFLIAIHQ